MSNSRMYFYVCDTRIIMMIIPEMIVEPNVQNYERDESWIVGKEAPNFRLSRNIWK